MRRIACAAAILLAMLVAVPSTAAPVSETREKAFRTHTMKLTLRPLEWKEVGSFQVVGAKKVLKRPSGYHSGYASYNLNYNDTRNVAVIQEALAFGSGIIVVRLVDDYDTRGFKGRIVRGTGSYRGIEGRVTGRNTNRIKLTYHFTR
jgi:hypothetical protein